MKEYCTSSAIHIELQINFKNKYQGSSVTDKSKKKRDLFSVDVNVHRFRKIPPLPKNHLQPSSHRNM